MMEKKGMSRCGMGSFCTFLLIVGGLNWGLVGVGGFASQNWNVVNLLLGSWPTVEWIVYILVGLAAIWQIFSWNCCCGGMCKVGKESMMK